MLKIVRDIIESNDIIKPNSKEMEVLREYFPACFATDGTFDIERFKEYLSDKIDVTNDGYELRFLGKNYAKLLASIETTTVIKNITISRKMQRVKIFTSAETIWTV